MVDFGQRLKKLRLEKNLTQKQLATLIGVRNSIISFYEVGDRMPSVEIIIKLSAVFHVSTDYLMGISPCKSLNIDGLSEEDISIVSQLVDLLRKKQNR